MPLYEYECKKCGNRVEVIHGVDEEGPKTCPKCKGHLKRLLGVPGLIFKGSGFYVNDYARKDTFSGKRGNSSTRASSDNGDSGKAEETTKEKSTDSADKPVAKSAGESSTTSQSVSDSGV
ncbi:MAG: zinc ribbon domain-containing protein [Candidatus Coatesbacteria bacterium]|nr:zinc ribbon domain-containing protein [Candidatus Coatesbacteria bacterium]